MTEKRKPPIPRWAGVLIVLVVGAGIWFAASRFGNSKTGHLTVSSEGSEQLSRDMDSMIGKTNVTIRVDGPETATATYAVGGTSKDVSTFPKKIKVAGYSGDDVTVRVDHGGAGTRAEVTCSIEIDGVEVDSDSDSVSASCSGSVS